MGHERSEYTRKKWICMLVSLISIPVLVYHKSVITFLRFYHTQKAIRPVYETIPGPNNAYPAPQCRPRVVLTLP